MQPQLPQMAASTRPTTELMTLRPTFQLTPNPSSLKLYPLSLSALPFLRARTKHTQATHHQSFLSSPAVSQTLMLFHKPAPSYLEVESRTTNLTDYQAELCLGMVIPD